MHNHKEEDVKDLTSLSKLLLQQLYKKRLANKKLDEISNDVKFGSMMSSRRIFGELEKNMDDEIGVTGPMSETQRTADTWPLPVAWPEDDSVPLYFLHKIAKDSHKEI